MTAVGRGLLITELVSTARQIAAYTLVGRLGRNERRTAMLLIRRLRRTLDTLEQACTSRSGDCFICDRPIALHFKRGRKLDCTEVRE